MNFDKMKVLNSKDPFEICILVYSIHFKLNVFKETDEAEWKTFCDAVFLTISESIPLCQTRLEER